MAEKLKSFVFNGVGRPSVSRYDKFLDGEIYRLSAGIDITNVPAGISSVRAAAKKRGLKVRTSIEGNDLIVQAILPAKKK